MESSRKHSFCLNCGYALDKGYNYCPSCGQRNVDSRIPFRVMVGEVISNYFALDSKFGRTIKPFCLKPGELTVSFMQGKRQLYAHPVRIYLISSLFFFTIITGFLTGLLERFKMEHYEGLEAPEAKENVFIPSDFSKNSADEESIFLFSKMDLNKLDSLANLEYYSDSQVLDSISLKSLTPFERFIGSQMVRTNRAGDEVILSYVLQNLSIMMLILIPIFALLLKVFYLRTEHFYITHLIHGFYLHSFVYFFLGVSVIFSRILTSNTSIIILFLLSFLIILIYGFISFLRIYKQSFLKTLLKFGGISLVYFHLLSILFLIEMLISFLLY